MKNAFIVVIVAMAVALSGCVTFKSLKGERVATINKVCIQSELTGNPEFVKLGTTAFGNRTSEVQGAQVFQKIEADFRGEVQSRGYEIVEDCRLSDVIIRLEKRRSYNHPSEKGVSGAGFFVHTLLGINPGIQAQSFIRVEIIDTRTRDVLATAGIPREAISKVRRNVDTWDEFTDEEKATLLKILEESLEGVAKQALDGMGFVRKR